MKYISPFLLLILFGLFSHTKPQNTRYFVQFKINSISTFEEAADINAKMASKSGVYASRADHITSTYFCYLQEGANHDEADFENWFKKMGYTITCFNKGVDTKDEVISPYILKNCQDEK